MNKNKALEARSVQAAPLKERCVRKRKGVAESVLVACVGSLFFIAWGIYANWGHGMRAVVRVGLVQGLISFTSTFLSVELLRVLFRVFDWPFLRPIATVSCGVLLINGSVYLAHRLAGTPEVFATMLPGASISVFFCCGITYRLSVLQAKDR